MNIHVYTCIHGYIHISNECIIYIEDTINSYVI